MVDVRLISVRSIGLKKSNNKEELRMDSTNFLIYIDTKQKGLVLTHPLLKHIFLQQSKESKGRGMKRLTAKYFSCGI